MLLVYIVFDLMTTYYHGCLMDHDYGWWTADRHEQQTLANLSINVCTSSGETDAEAFMKRMNIARMAQINVYPRRREHGLYSPFWLCWRTAESGMATRPHDRALVVKICQTNTGRKYGKHVWQGNKLIKYLPKRVSSKYSWFDPRYSFTFLSPKELQTRRSS